MLVPIGIINERHEPPVFHGVERPFVDTVIIPTTWFEAGAGVHGELGRGLRYRAYVMAPLDAPEFSADEGHSRGTPEGLRAPTCATSRSPGALEYVGVRGLTLGASGWRGNVEPSTLPRLDTTVTLGEVDARYRRDRLELRGQFARVGIGDAAQLNDAHRPSAPACRPTSPSAAGLLRRSQLSRSGPPGSPRDLVGFVRYENFDTQFRMPAGFLPLKEFDRDAWVTGVAYYPDPDVAVKVDYIWQRNQSVDHQPRRLVQHRSRLVVLT